MTNIERFIKDTVVGGWKGLYFPGGIEIDAENRMVCGATKEGHPRCQSVQGILLDPAAWKAVGEVRGWNDSKEFRLEWAHKGLPVGEGTHWLYLMHVLIDALAEGKSVEEYLGTI